MFGFSQKETGAKDVAMYISGAKFEDHCSNISGDILNSVFYPFWWNDLWSHHFPHLHNTKTWISLKRKKIFQKGKHRSSLLWKAFQISSYYFLLHRHFKLSSKDVLLKYIMFCYIFLSLGITLLELASDLDLPRGGYAWHQLRNGQLPDMFTQGLYQHKTHIQL